MAQARKTIALLPLCGAERGAAVCEQVGRCLAEVSQSNVALLNLQRSPNAEHATAYASDSGMPLAARWLSPSLALIAPGADPAPGQALATLNTLIRYAVPRASQVLADLSPLAERDRAVALAAAHLFDGVVVLIEAGVTSEGDVVRTLREIAPERNLGIVLLRS